MARPGLKHSISYLKSWNYRCIDRTHIYEAAGAMFICDPSSWGIYVGERFLTVSFDTTKIQYVINYPKRDELTVYIIQNEVMVNVDRLPVWIPRGFERHYRGDYSEFVPMIQAWLDKFDI